MMEIILDIINVIKNFIQSEHFDISIFQNLYLALLTILIPISLYILQEKDFSFEWEKIAIIDKIIKFKELISYTIIFFLSLLLIKIDISIFIFAYLLIIISIYKVLKIITNSLKWILDIYGGDFRFNIRKKYIEKLPYDKKLDFWKITWSKNILDSRFEEFLLNNFFEDLDKLYKNKNLDLYKEYLAVFVNNFINKLNSSIEKSISDKKDHLYLIDFNWQVYLEKTIEHHKTLSISLYNTFDKVSFAPLIYSTHNILSQSYLYPIYINEFFNIIRKDSSIFKYTYPQIFNDFFKNIVDEDKTFDVYLDSDNQINTKNNDSFQKEMFKKFCIYIKDNYIAKIKKSEIKYTYSKENSKTPSDSLKEIIKITEIIFEYDESNQILLCDLILILNLSQKYDENMIKNINKNLKESESAYIRSNNYSYGIKIYIKFREDVNISYTRQILYNNYFNIISDDEELKKRNETSKSNFKKSMQNLKNSNDEELQKIYNRLEEYLDTKTS